MRTGLAGKGGGDQHCRPARTVEVDHRLVDGNSTVGLVERLAPVGNPTRPRVGLGQAGRGRHEMWEV